MKFHSKIFVSYLIIFCATIFLTGCFPSSVAKTEEEKKDKPEILASERLITKLEANRKKIRNVIGKGTLTLKTPDFNNSAFFEVTIKKPDTIFVQIYGPFGIDLAKILISKDKFEFYDALHNALYKGDLTSDVLKSIFKIDMKLSEIVDALAGSVNLDKRLYNPPTLYEIKDKKYIVTYIDTADSKKSQYLIDIADLAITKTTTTDSKGIVLMEGIYNDFQFFDGVPIPYKIELNNYKNKQNIIVEYNRLNANEKDVKIEFKVPDDAAIIQW